MIATGPNAFELFGTPHLVVMALTVIVPIALAGACGRGRRARTTRTICWALAGMLVINELVVYVHSLATHGAGYFLATKLPLHMCGVGLYLAAYMLIRPGQRIYEVAFFWGLAGTLNAIITPNIESAFPSYDFVQFFITHSGIVAVVLFATWGLRMRPRPRGVFYAFLAGNVLVAVVAIANWLGRTFHSAAPGDWNYMFLCAKPGGAAGDSPFFFVDWPWYILALQPVAFVLLWLLYAPFPICDKLRAWRARHGLAQAGGAERR